MTIMTTMVTRMIPSARMIHGFSVAYATRMILPVELGFDTGVHGRAGVVSGTNKGFKIGRAHV